jgi:hypothetical protein
MSLWDLKVIKQNGDVIDIVPGHFYALELFCYQYLITSTY